MMCSRYNSAIRVIFGLSLVSEFISRHSLDFYGVLLAFARSLGYIQATRLILFGF